MTWRPWLPAHALLSCSSVILNEALLYHNRLPLGTLDLMRQWAYQKLSELVSLCVNLARPQSYIIQPNANLGIALGVFYRCN